MSLPFPYPDTPSHRRATVPPSTAATILATMLSLALPLSLAALLGGCKKGGVDTASGTPPPEPDGRIVFESLIGDRTASNLGTRATSTGTTSSQWDKGDEIGVFMVPHSGPLATDATARNVAYTYTGTGNFTAEAEDAIFWPRIGRVDFVACHPWRADLTDCLYHIDLGGECDLRAMDFMYSDNAAGHSSGDVPLLRFRHSLSKLVFNVTDATGASLDGLGAVVSGTPTRGTFDLAAGKLTTDGGVTDGMVAAWVDDGDGMRPTARLEAIAMPGTVEAPVVDFSLADGSTARLALARSSWREGNIYIYNVRITGGGEVVLAGGATIEDWNDRGAGPTEHSIERQDGPSDPDDPDDPSDPGDPDDPDDPDDPGDPNDPDAPGSYFWETFGEDTVGENVSVADYKGWRTPPPVAFSDRFGGARVSHTAAFGTHLLFPAGANVDFKIDGLPSDRADIVLSYDITTLSGGTGAGTIKVFVDGENLTHQVTATIVSPGAWVTVRIAVPSAAAQVRFSTDGMSNTHGFRLDNVRLEEMEN